MYCIALKDTREFKPNVKNYYLKNPLFLPVEMTFNDICKFWWWVLKLADHGILHIVVAHIWSVKDSTILVLCTRIPLCIYHDNVLQQVKWASLLNLTVFFITHIYVLRTLCIRIHKEAIKQVCKSCHLENSNLRNLPYIVKQNYPCYEVV